MPPVKPNFLEKFDGSGRQPRPLQTEILNTLSDNWHDFRIHVVNAPVGTGKSSIARAIQLTVGAHIITPQNVLIDQYTRDYPMVNALKGISNYYCRQDPSMTCHDRREENPTHKCSDCLYEIAKKRAAEEPTFFNPMSLYYAQQAGTGKGVKFYPTIVIDEAHSLLPMLSAVLGITYKQDRIAFDPTKVMGTDRGYITWLERTIRNHQKMLDYARYVKDIKRTKELASFIRRSELHLEFFRKAPHEFLREVRETISPIGKVNRELIVQPLRVPKRILNKLLGADTRIVLLSGTLFPGDIQEILEHESYKFYDLESPFPVENRIIEWQPLSNTNWETPIEHYFDAIVKDLERFPDRNTIIHVTYEMQEKLSKPLQERFPNRNIFVNTPENKTKIINKFKKEGGIFLASGCAEGLDLSGDTCRLNIIPKIEFPSLLDKVVQKRKALPGGESWYRQQALKSTIQRYGRSTRSVDDWSLTIIHDANLLSLIRAEQRTGTTIPSYFLEAIRVI